MLFFVIIAGIWLLGAFFGAPRRARFILMGMVYAAILIGQLAPVEPNPVQQLFGGNFATWVLIGLTGVAIWGYSKWLKRLRHRAGQDDETDAPEGAFNAAELDRYARHIVLRDIGGPGQQRLKAAKVLVIGAGGLGAPVLTYLAAAGVGVIGVIDDDEVSESNLQRQVIFDADDTGTPKVKAAAAKLRALNPHIEIRPYERRLDTDIAADLIADYDLVLDGSDNFDTRYLVNATCVTLSKPLISGALSQWEGQVSVFDRAAGGPCYACVFPAPPAPELAPDCATAGVLGPLPGVVGAMMATEAVKHITGAGSILRGQMLIYDALHAETRRIGTKRRADCKVCGDATAS